MFLKRFGDIYVTPASCSAVWSLELALGFELHLPLLCREATVTAVFLITQETEYALSRSKESVPKETCYLNFIRVISTWRLIPQICRDI